MRIKVFFLRGSDVTVDCARVALTPDTLAIYKSGPENDAKEQVVAEFYRVGIAGWKRED